MKQKKTLIILSIVCLLCIAGMILALTLGKREKVVFTPPPFEESAQTGAPEVSEDSYGQLELQTYSVMLCGNPELMKKGLQLWLTNPESNHAWIKVRVFDTEETLLGESGLLRPGEYLQYVALQQRLEPGEDVILVVMGYEPDTYHSIGNAKLQISISESTR